MSIKVMTLVWDAYPASGSELLAMLAMADWCNDSGGSLYPSMAAVAEKIRVSEKQARRIIQSIVDRGFMRVVGNEHGGKPGTTKQFQIEVGKLRGFISAKDSGMTPPMGVTPPASVTPPMQGIDPSHRRPSTPPTGGSLTVIEPLIEPLKGEAPAQAQALHIPAGLLADFLAVRKAKKAGPLTETVIKGLQREADKAGVSLEVAVTACCEYGWQGFNAGWYAQRTEKQGSGVTPTETTYQRSMREKYQQFTGALTAHAIDVTPRSQEILK